MTDELSLRRDADRAAKADALLRNETLIEMLDGLEASYATAWATTDARDTQGREICFYALKGAQRFRKDLQTAVDNGKIALHELAALEKREGAA